MESMTQRLGPAYAEALASLFSTIASDATADRFHPHPFTRETATAIANAAGRDLYLGHWVGGELCGYGMLRGWDAGYAIPSLGIYMVPGARGGGHAQTLMLALHQHALAAGAKQVRLKVYPDNTPAVRLYERLGYAFDSVENGQRVGIKTLAG
jgi:ribosomal protein S18 acetylase RimI-like enzyme